MAKQFVDNESLASFVIREIRHAHEPIISILKIVESLENGDIILLNLMTGLAERATKESISSDYKSVTGKVLQETFMFIYDTHGLPELSETLINH